MINIKSFLNLTYYTSELDEFLAQYDKNHPHLSESQHAEVEKYKQVFKNRDIIERDQPKKAVWDNF